MQLIPSEYILASFFPLGMRSFLSGFSVHSGFSHPLFNFLRHRTEPRMGRTENLSRAQLSSCKEGITDSGEQCKAVMGWASPAAKRISFSQINISSQSKRLHEVAKRVLAWERGHLDSALLSCLASLESFNLSGLQLPNLQNPLLT